MALKIAMIGAGSVGFTRGLLRDILSVPELTDTQFAFHDLSAHNMDMVTQLCRRDIAANGLAATVTPTTDRRAAIADADYVLCMIRQGGLEAFQSDIDIPLKYGVDQCVGDTLCAGGLMYAQRTIPALLDFCRDIREAAKPGAILLNYSNPMAMNTWACNKYGGVKTVGLCHGVQGAHWQITRATEQWAKGEGMLGPDEKLHRRDVDAVFAGINHQTWCVRAVVGRPRPDPSDVRDDVRRRRLQHGREGAIGRSEAARLLQHGKQRAPLGVPAVVSQARRRDPRLDQPALVDQRRDGGLSAGLHRGPELVRAGLPELDGAGAAQVFAGRNAVRSTARTSSNRWKRAGCIGATSTSSTRATSRTCRTAASSRSPAMWTSNGN